MALSVPLSRFTSRVGGGSALDVMRKLHLCSDFPDHVLWDWSEDGKPIAPESLGLSDETCRMLREWYKLWSQIWCVDRPRSGADSQVDWLLFDEKGIEVWKRAQRELAGRYQVVFYSHRLEDDSEDPEKLETLLRNVPNA
jgi:hypothetical protein